MRAVWHVMVGRGCGTGAASSDGVAADHSGGDGIPAPLPVVCRMWGTPAGGVASDDARREFWAARASPGRVCDGTKRRESAGSAGPLSDAVAAGGERRRDWRICTGGEWRGWRAGDRGTNGFAGAVGAGWRGDGVGGGEAGEGGWG